jgi:hypothetical protein
MGAGWEGQGMCKLAFKVFWMENLTEGEQLENLEAEVGILRS